jgi:murein DD-endopeptidase MepM/ murein hydrolase activator NlpD
MNNSEYQHTVMQRDFKSSPPPATARMNKAPLMGLVASLSLFVAVSLLVTNNATATRNAPLPSPSRLDDALLSEEIVRISLPLALPERAGDETAVSDEVAPSEPETAAIWRTETVRKGDSLALIFSRLGLSAQELDRALRAGDAAKRLKHLVPGQQLTFAIDNGELQQLIYEIDPLNTLNVSRGGDGGFSATTTARELETRVTNAAGTIDSSLFLAGQAAGLSDSLIMELAGIFGWDIDFALDIRSGDRFSLVYEEKYLDGNKVQDGNILAAEFVNRGTSFRALRYTDTSSRADYYSPDGKSMRKAFLRTPVDFTRISSRFGSRMHPVLGTLKNHHGVDYAAPTGTPVKSAGDGKVIHVGSKGGYGRTVIIQHGGKYSTLYAHLSKYKGGLSNGSRVRQGQIIGYVGSTGRSTGPHLHYEFRIDGVHRNPLTVRLPDAAPIQAEYQADFLAKSRGLVSLLDVMARTDIALNH